MFCIICPLSLCMHAFYTNVVIIHFVFQYYKVKNAYMSIIQTVLVWNTTAIAIYIFNAYRTEIDLCVSYYTIKICIIIHILYNIKRVVYIHLHVCILYVLCI